MQQVKFDKYQTSCIDNDTIESIQDAFEWEAITIKGK